MYKTCWLGSDLLGLARRQSRIQNLICLHFLYRFMHPGKHKIILYYFRHLLWDTHSSFAPFFISHLTFTQLPSLKYAVFMFVSALTDVIAYPSQFLPSLFLPPPLLCVSQPPHSLPLLLPVGGTPGAALARYLHLVPAAQHWAMFLLTSRLTVLKL